MKTWNVDPRWEPIPGIGPGPLTDEEFEARVKVLTERDGSDPEAYRTSGVYVSEGVDDAPAEAEEAVP